MGRGVPGEEGGGAGMTLRLVCCVKILSFPRSAAPERGLWRRVYEGFFVPLSQLVCKSETASKSLHKKDKDFGLLNLRKRIQREPREQCVVTRGQRASCCPPLAEITSR